MGNGSYKVESEVKIEDGKIVLSDKLAEEISRWGKRLKACLEGHSLIIAPADEIDLLEPAVDPLHPQIQYRRGDEGMNGASGEEQLAFAVV